MKKATPADTPDAYVTALCGWRRDFVEMVRVEEERVLFGFWRGQRLREIDARLKPGGKYEMATIISNQSVVA
jgi:hypothetical protein